VRRLIDANALMDDFREYVAQRHDRERCVSEENCNACDRECLWRRVVKNAPTVDAVEVVHGRWILEFYSYSTPKCSVCGWKAPYCEDCGYEVGNYCPNCGSKMDGDGNG
jgi:hypothetical protein